MFIYFAFNILTGHDIVLKDYNILNKCINALIAGDRNVCVEVNQK